MNKRKPKSKQNDGLPAQRKRIINNQTTMKKDDHHNPEGAKRNDIVELNKEDVFGSEIDNYKKNYYKNVDYFELEGNIINVIGLNKKNLFVFLFDNKLQFFNASITDYHTNVGLKEYMKYENTEGIGSNDRYKSVLIIHKTDPKKLNYPLLFIYLSSGDVEVIDMECQSVVQRLTIEKNLDDLLYLEDEKLICGKDGECNLRIYSLEMINGECVVEEKDKMPIGNAEYYPLNNGKHFYLKINRVLGRFYYSIDGDKQEMKNIIIEDEMIEDERIVHMEEYKDMLLVLFSNSLFKIFSLSDQYYGEQIFSQEIPHSKCFDVSTDQHNSSFICFALDLPKIGASVSIYEFLEVSKIDHIETSPIIGKINLTGVLEIKTKIEQKIKTIKFTNYTKGIFYISEKGDKSPSNKRKSNKKNVFSVFNFKEDLDIKFKIN